ncbi:MAG: LysM peptidoglycan-binding domain-containing protein [Mariprofundus sp.]
MIFKHYLLPGLVALLLLAPLTNLQAETSPGTNRQTIKADLPQPYIVKKGDTLWDIADYFFNKPMQWLKIWEKNLYITNPDLIYPGNKIWFDPQRGLTTTRPGPQVIIRPVQRLDGITDKSLLLTALERQDFIRADQEQGVGHILSSPDERLNFGVHDRVYLKLDQPAAAGALFDIFRTTDTVINPKTGETLGILVEHLGQVQTNSEANGIYRGIINKAFAEISRGDRLKPARVIDPHLQATEPEQALSGQVIYIRNGAHEAAQHQVIGISLGLQQQLKAGTMLSIMRDGRIITDPIDKQPVQLPAEKIGDLIVLIPQQKVSIALITGSTAPINIGDTVSGLALPGTHKSHHKTLAHGADQGAVRR